MTIHQLPPDRVVEAPVLVTEQPRYNFRLAAGIGFVVGVIDVVIAGRFLLKLLGAAPDSPFVNFIYQVSAPLVAPFRGIFGGASTGANSFEPAALVAIAVYSLIGWGLIVLVRITTAPRGTRPADS